MLKMYTVAETFVGAGGSHLGFKNVGFVTKYVNDFDENCLKTLLHNNPEIKDTAFVDNTSIVDVDPSEIMKKAHIKQGELDVFFGGIVCKGFSLAGERSPNDPRNYFYRKQLEIIGKFLPKISIIENVPGILNAKVIKSDIDDSTKQEIDSLWKEIENYKGKKANLRKTNSITEDFEERGRALRKRKTELLEYLEKNNLMISVIDDITRIYEKIGYKVKKRILNSADFGAATKRDRAIIVAVRNDIKYEFNYPEETHSKENYNTVLSALKRIDYNNQDDADNIPMQHSEKTRLRFSYIPMGDNISNHLEKLPDELRISKFYSRGSTMRLSENRPSPTLVPGHSNFPVHPTQDRCITVREAATITGFPTNYKFFGSHTKRCEQVGNAVPPNLSQALAKEAKVLLDKVYSER